MADTAPEQPRFQSPATAQLWRPPENACDTHMHIFGPYDKFPIRPDATRLPAQASVEAYQAMAQFTGLQRMVVVQPSFYGSNNTCTLDMVARAGERGRAVVVVDSSITEDELLSLHLLGARGVRLQSVVPGGVSIDDMEDIASRIKDLGWHIQLFLDDTALPALKDRLNALPVPVVVDHMAHLHEDADDDTPGMRVLLDLMERGHGWVKLSNAFFPPCARRAKRFIAANSERVLWGSDWPHVGYRHTPPDDGALLNQLAHWAQEKKTWNRILFTNPDYLYFR